MFRGGWTRTFPGAIGHFEEARLPPIMRGVFSRRTIDYFVGWVKPDRNHHWLDPAARDFPRQFTNRDEADAAAAIPSVKRISSWTTSSPGKMMPSSVWFSMANSSNFSTLGRKSFYAGRSTDWAQPRAEAKPFQCSIKLRHSGFDVGDAERLSACCRRRGESAKNGREFSRRQNGRLDGSRIANRPHPQSGSPPGGSGHGKMIN